MARAVIATIGEDRPGLVNELSKMVLELGLNIEDSRMTVLGGEFAVLMAVAGDEPVLATLETQLGELADSSGLAYLYRPTTDRRQVGSDIYRITVEAMDHPGIVHSIAGFFSERSINIRELETQTQPAAHTGTPVFSVEMEVEVPASTNTAELETAFAQFCVERSLDGEMSAD
jgi:glycine cleavage system transcriptional repressor